MPISPDEFDEEGKVNALTPIYVAESAEPAAEKPERKGRKLPLVFALIAIAVLFVGYLAWPKSSVQVQLEIGVKAAKQGDWGTAVSSLSTISTYPVSRVYRAEGLGQLKRPSEAIDLIFSDPEAQNRFVDLYQNSYYVYYPERLAGAAIKNGDLAAAAGECKNQPDSNWFDDDTDALVNCGVALAYAQNATGEDVEKAKSYLQHVIEYSDAEVADHSVKSAAQIDLGTLLMKVNGDSDKALALYARYVEANPGEAVAEINYGFLLANHQRYAEAAVQFRKAATGESKNDAGEFLRIVLRKQAETAARAGQWAKASKLLNQAIRTTGPPDLTWVEWERLLVFCALNSGQWQLAEAKAAVLAQYAPEETPHWEGRVQRWVKFDSRAEYNYWLGQARMQQGNRDGAVNAWEKAQARHPDDLWIAEEIRLAKLR